MAIAFLPRLARRINGVASPAWLCSLALLGIGAADAKAEFIGYYAPANFTLTNTGGGFTTIDGVDYPTANGSVLFPDLLTLVLTGTHDGSGNAGWTDLTITAPANGFFQFNYIFTAFGGYPPQSADPQTQYACILVGSNACAPSVPGEQRVPSMFFLADEDGVTGSVRISVTAGELFGFRVGGDNMGGVPGVLTVSDFSAPVPEPGTIQLFGVAAAAGAALVYRRRKRISR